MFYRPKCLVFEAGLLAFAVSSGTWTNCSAAELQLRTSPSGAVLIENDTGVRYRAPINLSYTLSERDRDASGCYVVKGFQAVWESGAHTEMPKISLCGSGPIWNYRFERPPVPRQDIDFAFEQKITKQQDQLAKQQRGSELLRAGIQGFLSGYFGASRAYVPPPIDVSRTMPNASSGAQNGSGSSLPQITPDGSYVSGAKPYSICPNGKYVSGNCTLAPDGSYIGQ